MLFGNARFWGWVNNGWVKITLRPGESIEHCSGGQTDEGYSVSRVRWELPAYEPVVRREWAHEGRDCDGRLDHYGEDECPIADLRARDMGDDCRGILAPEWSNRRTSQRDYAAYEAEPDDIADTTAEAVETE